MSARFVETPHLPRGKVGLLAIGARYRALLGAHLARCGVQTLWLPDNPRVDPRLAGHADLSLLHLGGESLVTSREADIVNLLTNRGLRCIEMESEQSVVYPRDCPLNGCLVGRHFFHRLRCTDPQVLRALPETTVRVDLRQGYTKCSVCVVDTRSIITADAGIARAAERHGIDALLIPAGFVELPGFPAGFIGGAAFKLSESELAFTGELDTHPSSKEIRRFLDARAIRPLSLRSGPLLDIGSAIPLLEA